MVRVQAGRGSIWCHEAANSLTGVSPGTTTCGSLAEKYAQQTLQSEVFAHSITHEWWEVVVDVLYERCCGLDIHKKLVVACLITPGPKRVPSKEVRSFGTMTHDLLALGDWLLDQSVTHVAMEATGVYWKPLFNLLEERFTLVLANAQHIKQVPGRKTDVRDCEWIADLLRHGLLRASYVPDRPQRELRELTRYRTTLVRERAREVNRIQKTLEGANVKGANVKLGDVASDVLGTSGRAMLDALVNGTTDAAALADLARGRLRDKLDRLEQALSGRMGNHQRFLLAEQLRHLDSLDQRIDRVSAEIAERVRPFEALIERLDAIPGVGRRVAEVLVAEVGADMTRFPSAAHLASWAGICPGNNESAGKQKAAASGAGIRGCAWLWSKPPMLQCGQRTPTWLRSSGVLPLVEAPRRRR
jgi:transposase